jgi:hypothetical protein
MTFTAEEKFKCAAREWEMRRRVYPRWIEQGRMAQEKSAREIALMAEIADDYRELAAMERFVLVELAHCPTIEANDAAYDDVRTSGGIAEAP